MAEPARAPHLGEPLASLSADALAEAVAWHDHAYFVLDAPVIPDQLYDQMVERLRAIAPGHPVLKQVGGGFAGPGAKVEHAEAMLSLGKCYSGDELAAWLRGAYRESGRADDADHIERVTLVATPKVDGLACTIRYDAHGLLVQSATRGDGRRGEDITHNVRRMPSVPGQLAGRVETPDGPRAVPALEVRGEVYLPLSAFEAVADVYANARNLAAGTLKAKEEGGVPAEQLVFFAYDLRTDDEAFAPDTEHERLALLEALGFLPVPADRCRLAEASAVYERWQQARPELDYELDGVVFKLDDLAEQRRLGTTAHHPRYAIAWKFQGDSGTTTLQDIEWSVSRTGTITPVAIVAPVVLSGATVTRATLHNVSRFEELGLHRGDTLALTRRGGVIPHVETNLGGGGAAFAVPETLPGTTLATERRVSERKVAGEVVVTTTLHLRDPDASPVVQRARLVHFADAMEIDGLGAKMVDLLLEHGLVRQPADLYELTPDQLAKLPRVGVVLANKLVAGIRGRSEVPIALFLRALGIDGLGAHAATLLAARFDLDGLLQAELDALTALHSLGDKTARGVLEGLREREEMITALRKHLRIVDAKADGQGEGVDADAPFAGETVCFTGALETLTRRDAQQVVSRLGGRASSSVTKETSLVVVGGDPETDKPSSKLKKARKLREAGEAVTIISEHAFRARAGLDAG